MVTKRPQRSKPSSTGSRDDATDDQRRWQAEGFAPLAKLEAPRAKQVREMLRWYLDTGYDQLSLDDNTTLIRTHLDLVLHELRERPDLRAAFEQHALMQDYLRIPERDDTPDVVAEEIAREVKIKWADRKNSEYRDQPWAWLRRADLFVAHVYNKWHSKNVLRLKHLAHDPQLYDSYRTVIRRHPDRDLHLPVEDKPVPDARLGNSVKRPSHVRVPISKLSEQDVARRRQRKPRQKNPS